MDSGLKNYEYCCTKRFFNLQVQFLKPGKDVLHAPGPKASLCPLWRQICYVSTVHRCATM